jgi:DNA-binding NtrC family response regulator
VLSRAAQAALVRFLEHGASSGRWHGIAAGRSTRIVSATSREIESDVQAGRVPRELFFRLNAAMIHLPPLRERRDDLPRLTGRIVADLCTRHHRIRVELASDVHEALRAYEWRGNLRELEMVLEHAIVLARTDTVQLADLPERLWARG